MFRRNSCINPPQAFYYLIARNKDILGIIPAVLLIQLNIQPIRVTT